MSPCFCLSFGQSAPQSPACNTAMRLQIWNLANQAMEPTSCKLWGLSSHSRIRSFARVRDAYSHILTMEKWGARNDVSPVTVALCPGSEPQHSRDLLRCLQLGFWTSTQARDCMQCGNGPADGQSGQAILQLGEPCNPQKMRAAKARPGWNEILSTGAAKELRIARKMRPCQSQF